MNSTERLYIEVRGIVQGVGFRPYIYRLAKNHHLNGWVRNTSGNVAIEIEGAEENVSRFLSLLKEKAPSAALIQDVTVEKLPVKGDIDFEIRKSQPEPEKYQPVSPDLATCPECLEEVFDPTGAGDTFGGGMMGYLASTDNVEPENVRRAIVFGSAMASFNVERFSFDRLRSLEYSEVAERFREFIGLTYFEAEL